MSGKPDLMPNLRSGWHHRLPVLLVRQPRFGGWFCAVAFLLAAGFRFIVSFPAARNADDANNLLAGVALVHGNWLLRGWSLAPDNYVPTDVLLQGLASLVLGFRPVVIEAMEALIWAGVALAAAGLACRGASGRTRVFAACVTVCLIVVLPDCANPAYGFLTGVGSHGSTILLGLAAFGLSTRTPADHPRAGRNLLLGVLVATGSFADPIFVTTCAVPLVGACLLQLRRRDLDHAAIGIVAATMAGLLLSRLAMSVMRHAGGFGSTPLGLQFAPFEETLAHLVFALHAVIALLGGDMFGMAVDRRFAGGAVLALLRLPLTLLLLATSVAAGFGLARDLRSWPGRQQATADALLERMLLLCALCCIAGSVLTRVIVDETCVRFFLPVTVVGTIIMVRRLRSVPLFAFYTAAVSALSVVAATVTLSRGPTRPVIASPAMWQVAQTLRAQGLRHGYAGYWESGLLTMLTGGEVTTLALIDERGKAARPFNWFADMDAYRSAVATWPGTVFLLTSDTPAGPLMLSRQTVLHMFGAPISTVQVGDVHVDVYTLDAAAIRRLGW